MKENVNRSQLVAAVGNHLRLRQATVRRVLDALVLEIERVLRCGGEVRLSGFGTFLMRKRGARPGRNLRSGERIVQPEQHVPAFRSSEKLRRRLGQQDKLSAEAADSSEDG